MPETLRIDAVCLDCDEVQYMLVARDAEGHEATYLLLPLPSEDDYAAR
jgi:hypothetical protein